MLRRACTPIFRARIRKLFRRQLSVTAKLRDCAHRVFVFFEKRKAYIFVLGIYFHGIRLVGTLALVRPLSCSSTRHLAPSERALSPLPGVSTRVKDSDGSHLRVAHFDRVRLERCEVRAHTLVHCRARCLVSVGLQHHLPGLEVFLLVFRRRVLLCLAHQGHDLVHQFLSHQRFHLPDTHSTHCPFHRHFLFDLCCGASRHQTRCCCRCC